MDELGMAELNIASTIDGSMEPSLFYYPEGCGNVPLVVGLHTWSAERTNQVSRMLPFCKEAPLKKSLANMERYDFNYTLMTFMGHVKKALRMLNELRGRR